MGTALVSHQCTSSIQDTITCVHSSQHRYPTLLGSIAYSKVLLRVTRTSQKVNIQNVPAHGKGRHSMKAFSVVGPTMWNELRKSTSVDVFKKGTENSYFPSSLLTVIPYSYFVIVDMYNFHCNCILVNTLD